MVGHVHDCADTVAEACVDLMDVAGAMVVVRKARAPGCLVVLHLKRPVFAAVWQRLLLK